MRHSPSQPTGQADSSPQRDGVRRRAQVGTVAVVIAVSAALLYWQRARLGGLPHALRNAVGPWIVVAVVAEFASLAALSGLHHRLLEVGGRQVPLRSVIATTYAGNAISVSLPLVGSTASTVFVYHRYLANGVGKVVAGWTLVIAGVYSAVAFAAISALGAILTGSSAVAVAGFATAIVGVLPVVAMLAGIRHDRVRRVAVALTAVILRLWAKVARRPGNDAAGRAESTIGQVASLHLSRANFWRVVLFAAGNWAADLGCLICVLYAVGAQIPWTGVVLAWAAGAAASSLGLTPGGLGVVEASLSLALIAAGLPGVVAVAAVLVYRFISLWLVLGAGAVVLMTIRTRPRAVRGLSAVPSTRAVLPAQRSRFDQAVPAERQASAMSALAPTPAATPMPSQSKQSVRRVPCDLAP